MRIGSRTCCTTPPGSTTRLVAVLAFSTVSLLFVFARFSFGYFIGFSLFTMVLGFIWLNSFSKFNYDHRLAGLSAAASAVLFLLPALLINAPVKQIFVLSPRALEYLLKFILVLALGTIIVASFYNFRLVSIRQIYDFRNELYFPAAIRYLTGIVSTVLLPFAFACYLALNRRWLAGLPLTPDAAVLSDHAEQICAFFVRLDPCRAGAFEDFRAQGRNRPVDPAADAARRDPDGNIPKRLYLHYFDLVNIRMMATPSSAMDIYNDFFSSHPLTYFCQVSFLKPLMSCPYQEQLSVVMEKAYQLGNFNASLFATEGIASVGLYFAPLVALGCGLVIAIGNRASAGLPPGFVLISSALLPETFLNVPFTTALLTHGAGFLFLLWYVMPRTIFEQKSNRKTTLGPDVTVDSQHTEASNR